MYWVIWSMEMVLLLDRFIWEFLEISFYRGRHIGKETYNYSSVHVRFVYGVRNENGENLHKFVLAKEMVIANSILRKKDEHLITYKSCGHATQIDYCLVRKSDRISCLDCKVVLGTEMPTQHRLLVLVFRMRKHIVQKKI